MNLTFAGQQHQILVNTKAKSIMTLLVKNVFLGFRLGQQLKKQLKQQEICVNNHRTHIKAYVLVACTPMDVGTGWAVTA